MIALFLKGLLLGLSIAAPVGHIGLLCIRKTLTEGRLSGFISGLGAATADGFYGAVAAFSLTAISFFLIKYQLLIRIIGGGFLLYLAVKIFFAKTARNETAAAERKLPLLRSYISTLFLTLTNPMTIVSFTLVFASLGVGTSGGIHDATATVIGVFFGSALWWLLLSVVVGVFREKFDGKNMVWVNRIAGILIAALGMFSILK